MSNSGADKTDIRSWLYHYSPAPNCYDELSTNDGQLRPVWSPSLEAFHALGDEEIESRRQHGQREFIRNGITYNPHADSGVESRPGHLDALPLVMSHDEWEHISNGMRQWATLGELILKDLFGPQKLLSDKIIPPDLLYAHPGYRLPYHNVHKPADTRLHLCASDLSRAPNGRWWTSGLRTRAPFGLGYVIENRVMMSRLYPEAYQAQHIERIAPFFVQLRETLQALSPRQKENPRIVMWSAGPSSPSYFEDAYLARYLNYTLVQSGDLAVRQNRVVLKTLRGLVPIDVLIRRVDDDKSDTVELDSVSNIGIAGLIETIRTENVGMANGLGCDILEAPVFYAFAQTLADQLLGETLAISPVATWWCGEPKGLDYVLTHLDSLIIRPAFARSDDESIQPNTLTEESKKSLIAQIRQDPGAFVGQERVAQSCTPGWHATGLEARRLGVRAYCVSSEEGYQTLQGGLATISPILPTTKEQYETAVRVQDVWVASNEHVKQTSLLRPLGEAIELRRHGGALPSRVCDNLYWLGRTMERIEALVRVQRVAYRVSSDDYESRFVEEFIDRIFESATDGKAVANKAADGNHSITEQERTLFDTSHPGGIQALVVQSVNLAFSVRDQIAVEMWHAVQSVEEKAKTLLHTRYRGDTAILGCLDELLEALSGFAGLTHESMTRTDAWIFLDLGTRIERATQNSNLMQAALVTPTANEHATLELLLDIADSIMTYRGRYLAIVQIAPVFDLLAIDESNPRSVAYQLVRIYDHVTSLRRNDEHARLGTDERLALAMMNSVRLFDAYAITSENKEGQRVRLSKQLSKLNVQLLKLSEAVSSTYLVHARTPRHLGQEFEYDA